MKKIIKFLKKYGSYITFLVGVFIYIVLFIAGGFKVTPSDASPLLNTIDGVDKEGIYHFTAFQGMFGKTLIIGGNKVRYFSPNWLGILGFFTLGIGVLIPTINKIKYRYRHMLGVLFLLFTGFTLFTLHKTARPGVGFGDGTKLGLGAPLIAAGVLAMVLALYELILSQLPSKKEMEENLPIEDK